MGRQEIANGGATMPRCPIPQEQDIPSGIGRQNGFEMLHGGLGGHPIGLGDDFLARREIEGAIKGRTGAIRIKPHRDWLPTGSPDRHGRRLQIQCGRIFREDREGRWVGGEVSKFFSIWPSHSMTARSLRVRKVAVGRWYVNPTRANSVE